MNRSEQTRWMLASERFGAAKKTLFLEQVVMKLPFFRGIKTIQIYGNFAGFPL